MRNRDLRSAIFKRLQQAGLCDPCPHCKGSGYIAGSRYNGGICYVCRGRRAAPISLNRALLQRLSSAEAREKVAVLALKFARRDAARKLPDLTERMWRETGISRLFSHSKATTGGEDARLSAINDKMAQACRRVESAVRAMEAALSSGNDSRADDYAEEAAALARRAIEEIARLASSI